MKRPLYMIKERKDYFPSPFSILALRSAKASISPSVVFSAALEAAFLAACLTILASSSLNKAV